MSLSALLDFLRRELSPTPGRSGATFRLTLACLAATIPVLTHRIPHALIVMIVMYLITQEDTAATIIGSILGAVGVTIGLGSALLALKVSLDIHWLRICFFIVFLLGGLFLKRVLTIGALGSAIGLPAALAMILPDILPPRPEVMVEFILWIWWCAVLGLSVNVGVQLLLSPGDPLMLLQRELDTRFLAVETTLRTLAGQETKDQEGASLKSLAIAGMSRPLALLKTASIIHRWAHMRNETLAALITITDRLVTSAIALETLAPRIAVNIGHERLLRVADGCARMRQAFEKLRLPARREWTALADEQVPGAASPLIDIERTLDQIALALPTYPEEVRKSGIAPAEKRSLFLQDAFDNPDYVRFAIKGSLAALICYLCFVGFDYPGIYTSVITCFVVSLSTIGASNQKGLLRFGGAAVGGGMGLIALMYLLPNVDTIGGFWLVFGAGTAVAAWANFGSPRISYGGYQVGLAFYKAVLQGFGPALSAKVVRDRLVGVFFGLAVFGIVEHVLWPVRARDALRTRLAEIMHLLAELARTRTGSDKPVASGATVDSWRRKISQKVENIQQLIESSKFELGDFKVDAIEKLTGDTQIVFVLLLSLSRRRQDVTHLNEVQAAEVELDGAMATALLALETHIAADSPPAKLNLEGLIDALESYAAVSAKFPGETSAGRVALYRALVTAIKAPFSELLNAAEEGHEVVDFARRGAARA
jgi:multidrug resistance protein MdtO